MEILKDAMETITKHVGMVIDSLDSEQVESLIDLLVNAEKIFVFGAGRSGLVGRAFAMRLMHLGLNCYVVGEIVTPAIEEGDVLLTISGSGETTSVVNAAKISKNAKSKIALITTYPNSSIGKIADQILLIKGREKAPGEKDFLMRQIKGEHYPLAPLGTLFEVSVLIFLDSLIPELMVRLNKSEDFMKTRHATIE